MKYVHPKSLTWWSGIIALTIGLAMIVCDTCDLTEIGQVFAALHGGDASPSGLIVLGLGLIGLRDKLERIT